MLGYKNTCQVYTIFGQKLLHTGEYYLGSLAKFEEFHKKHVRTYWGKYVFTKVTINGKILEL